MCFERKGKPMKKTLSLMTLSLLVAQPSFSSASDLVPVEEDVSSVSSPSVTSDGMTIVLQSLATPLSDLGLEDNVSSLLRVPFTLSSSRRSRWMPSLSSIPEDALMNTEELRASRKIVQDSNKVTFKKRSEKEISRLLAILEEDEGGF